MNWGALPFKVLLLKGNDPASFLKNYSCNEPSAAMNGFLDLRGRAVAVFHAIPKSDAEFWLLMSEAVVARLQKHLRVYLDLSGCALEELTGARVFLTDYRPNPPRDFVWLESKLLGLWVRFAGLPDGVEWGPEELTGRRIRAGFPLQGLDFDLPLILSLGDLSWVSLTKGCYLGQEIIARVHYRAQPPQKLEAVREAAIPDSSRAQMTSPWIDPNTGERWGFWFRPTAVLS